MNTTDLIKLYDNLKAAGVGEIDFLLDAHNEIENLQGLLKTSDFMEGVYRKALQELRTKCRRLVLERDEARILYCQEASDNPEEFAVECGWDCFEDVVDE